MPLHRSIFFKLNLFFVLALLTLGLFFTLFRVTTDHMEKRREGMRSMELERLLHHTRHEETTLRQAELASAEFTVIAPEAFPPDAVEVRPPRRVREDMKRIPKPPFALYEHEGTYYLRSSGPGKTVIVRDDRPPEEFLGVKLLFLLLFAGLFTLYFLLRRSLLPLRELHEQIRRFARGELDIDTSSTRRDEIAAIANEFNEALIQLRQLQDSRRLFLRNVMHELKTPLTKGKLALAMLEETEQHGYLDRLFNRMDDLINRIAQIEKIRSVGLEKEERHLGNLIESAIEHLYLEESRRHHIKIALSTNATVLVDTPLFVSALTNLIDNALKYAVAPPVLIIADAKELCIINRGAPLQKDIAELLRPFSGTNSGGGLGLGLAIADTVILAHGFRLSYDYTDGSHRFCIHLTPAP